MVAEFGRDTYGYNEEQMMAAAQKVREGDMTPVLKMYEKDLKVPSLLYL